MALDLASLDAAVVRRDVAQFHDDEVNPSPFRRLIRSGHALKLETGTSAPMPFIFAAMPWRPLSAMTAPSCHGIDAQISDQEHPQGAPKVNGELTGAVQRYGSPVTG
jgi:hypothetical protein